MTNSLNPGCRCVAGPPHGADLELSSRPDHWVSGTYVGQDEGGKYIVKPDKPYYRGGLDKDGNGSFAFAYPGSAEEAVREWNKKVLLLLEIFPFNLSERFYYDHILAICEEAIEAVSPLDGGTELAERIKKFVDKAKSVDDDWPLAPETYVAFWDLKEIAAAMLGEYDNLDSLISDGLDLKARAKEALDRLEFPEELSIPDAKTLLSESKQFSEGLHWHPKYGWLIDRG